MGKVVAAVKLISVLIGSIKVSASFKLLATAALVGYSLLNRPGVRRRDAQAATLQTGEVPRQAIFGRAAEAGSLVDAFNFGGKHGTDWEVLVIALADHRCDALEGFFVDDQYVAFTGDGAVAGFNGQLEVYWRSGQWDQSVPSILTSHGPGWTANDRGRGVAYVVAAYKGDDEKAKNPIWEGRRPRFRWIVRGLRCYQARKDTTVGGSGAHRRDDPSTWEWTENLIDLRYNWVRGIYAGDLVDQSEMLLIGRGLSDIEAPPQNVFARANLCDEVVDGAPRYRIGGVVSADEKFIEVESDFAAACGGVIVQPEGSVEINPGEARAPVAHFTDDDLIVSSKVNWSDFLGIDDDAWVNTVVARFVDPGQRWATRAAPVRRDTDDIIADGGPRERTLQLSLVNNLAQAGRVAEIARRFGRLWGRGSVTLPPRFAGIEEGDWVTWQSDRYFNGATRTFQVEAWGSDQGWRHQISLRQISASVFSEADELDDGVIAAQNPPPPPLAAPDDEVWTLASVLMIAGGMQLPALRITGTAEDPDAQLVRFEYVIGEDEPDEDTIWTEAALVRPDAVRVEFPITPGAEVRVAVSYITNGITGARRVLGPVFAEDIRYPNGVLLPALQPSEAGADITKSVNGAAEVVLQYASNGDLTSSLPVTATYQLVPAGGSAIGSGVTWSLAVVSGSFAGDAPSIVGSGSGQLRINSGLSSPDAQIRITATLAGRASPPVLVRVRRNVAAASNPGGGGGGGAFASASVSTGTSSTSFAAVASVLEITLPSGVTECELTAAAIELTRIAAAPPGSTPVEGKWQRETSPGTWADVGSAATSSPSPEVVDTGLEIEPGVPLYEANPGSLTCNRTATGLGAGSTQKFRFVARITTGSEVVTLNGTVSASA